MVGIKSYGLKGIRYKKKIAPKIISNGGDCSRKIKKPLVEKLMCKKNPRKAAGCRR